MVCGSCSGDTFGLFFVFGVFCCPDFVRVGSEDILLFSRMSGESRVDVETGVLLVGVGVWYVDDGMWTLRLLFDCFCWSVISSCNFCKDVCMVSRRTLTQESSSEVWRR